MSGKKGFRHTVRVTMPVSSFGYVLDLEMGLEYIVVDTRMDARLKILDARVSCFEFRCSIRASSPFN